MELPYKVTIGEKTFWHRMERDGVATIMTDNREIKLALCRLHSMFPDLVQLMYDGEDADYIRKGPDGEVVLGEDLKGTTTFYVSADCVRIKILPGRSDFALEAIQEEIDDGQD